MSAQASLPRDFFAAFGTTEPAPERWDGSEEHLWTLLRGIPDPEIPAISLVDLGIVRELHCESGTRAATVVITPTYAGCPATEAIRQQILRVLEAAGVTSPAIDLRISPPWTTDWITAAGREALQQFGITPPCTIAGNVPRALQFRPACPRCGSHQTEQISAFGATPCKALHRCQQCREPFDYFKPL